MLKCEHGERWKNDTSKPSTSQSTDNAKTLYSVPPASFKTKHQNEIKEEQYAFIEREIMKQRQWKLQMMKNDNDMGNLHEMPSRKGVKRKLSDKNNDSQQGSDIPICNVKKGHLLFLVM